MNISVLLLEASKHPTGSFERDKFCVQAILQVLELKDGYIFNYNLIESIARVIVDHNLDFAKAFIKLIKARHSNPQLLLSIVKSGNIELTKFLIQDCGESIDQFDCFCRCALVIACKSYHFEIAKWLINKKVLLPTTPEYSEAYKVKYKRAPVDDGHDVITYLFEKDQYELLDLLLSKQFRFNSHNLATVAFCYPKKFNKALDWWISNKISLDKCLKRIGSCDNLRIIKLFIEKTGYIPTDSDFSSSMSQDICLYLAKLKRANEIAIEIAKKRKQTELDLVNLINSLTKKEVGKIQNETVQWDPEAKSLVEFVLSLVKESL